MVKMTFPSDEDYEELGHHLCEADGMMHADRSASSSPRSAGDADKPRLSWSAWRGTAGSEWLAGAKVCRGG